MNKLTRVGLNAKNIFKSVRGNSSSAGHVVKDTGTPEKSLYDKYWNDGLPAFPERAIYRNNYGCGGWQRPKKQIVISHTCMGIFWCWIFWHLWHEYEHIIGHYHPPDPSQWTDEELGIPPDDVE